MNRRSHPFICYTSALVFVLLAVIIEKALVITHAGAAPLLFGAVMLSTWYGGLGPGLLAAILSGFADVYFFMEPIHTFVVEPDDVLQFVSSLGVALLISWLHGAIRRSQQQMAVAREQAVAANRAKDRFLAVLSHELRNPLNPVLSTAIVMERTATLPQWVRDDAAMIRRNVELEVRLIDDLLDLNRLHRGKLHVEFDRVDVHRLIHDTVRICHDEIERKAIRVNMHLPSQPRAVRGDSGRLRQVMWNLLRNAAKFTPENGTITIACADESDGMLRIEVRDSGIGIDPQSLPKIFGAFEQADGTIHQRFGGLGLGLAISKMLVDAHHGWMEAASEGKDRGATFSIHLPACTEVPSAGQAASVGLAVQPSASRSLRILLVEDHRDAARVMSQLLRSLGHEVIVAGTVASAIALADGGVDVAICDLRLPDGTGYELMRDLRNRHGIRGIAISGDGSEDAIRKSYQAGFASHLTKPISIDAIEIAIQQASAAMVANCRSA